MVQPSGAAAGLTAALAKFAIHTPYEALAAEVIAGVRRSQLDTLGVMIGGVAVDEAAADPRALRRRHRSTRLLGLDAE